MLKKNDRSLMSKYGRRRRWMPAKKSKKGWVLIDIMKRIGQRERV